MWRLVLLPTSAFSLGSAVPSHPSAGIFDVFSQFDVFLMTFSM